MKNLIRKKMREKYRNPKRKKKKSPCKGAVSENDQQMKQGVSERKK